MHNKQSYLIVGKEKSFKFYYGTKKNQYLVVLNKKLERFVCYLKGSKTQWEDRDDIE